MQIKIKAPAKINLSLKVGKRRNDGFHPIESIMQSINLFDILIISLNRSEKITLSGTSHDIPYDEKNIVHKAIRKYFEELGEMMFGVDVFIEKNIPKEAGLAGGSTDAAALLLGLNKLLHEPFEKKELHEICTQLGSDVNFCLEGGKKLCLGRGEILKDLPFEKKTLNLVKPKNFGVSTKVAYELFDTLKESSTFENDLEFAIIKKYPKIAYLHNLGLKMSGSGSAFYTFDKLPDELSDKDFNIWQGLETFEYGVSIL